MQKSFAIYPTSSPVQSPAVQSPAVLPAAEWDAFVRAHAQGHLLQTSAWGTLKCRFGWRDGGVAILDEAGQPRAGALLLYRRAAGLTLAYAPKGPLTDWHDHTLTAALLLQMVESSRWEGAAVLKIEPDLPDTAAYRALLRSYGLRPSRQTVQPRSTVLLEIAGNEEQILSQMKSKWRYNIRLAQRKEVTVRAATPADLPQFNALMQTTGTRDGFAVHSSDYYATAYDLFVPDDGVYLLAEYAGEALAAIVVCMVGRTAYYLWGASSDRERNRMPNHALQWAGIQWAKARGATCYDFWGIPDELGQLAQGLRNGDGSGTPSDDLPLDLEQLPHGELWGVYRFKQGFGGNVVRSVGAWDLAVDPVGYRLYAFGLGARAKWQQYNRARHQPPTNHSPTNQLTNPPPNQPPITLHPITTQLAWQQTLATLPQPHVLQSWEWGAIKGQTEWHAERYLVQRAAKPIAAFQFLWRQPLPYLPLRIGYVTKGPVVDWQDLDAVDATLAQIEAVARKHKCILVKIDPDVREDLTVGRLALHALERRGWRYSAEQIQFKNTGFSDLTGGEETLLAEMKSKWRYNIRLAEKRGIQIRQGTAADLPAFYALYAETGQRDGFLIRPYSYYQATWATFLQAQAVDDNPAGGTLLLAEHAEENTPLAGLFLFRYGDRTWYFYGASSERRRRDMPNYLLQWAALRWAQGQGCQVYDWWGAPTQIADEADGLQGVWQFKQGFGAAFQPHIGAWDFPVSPLRYRLFQEALPRVRQWLRRLR